MRIQPLPLMSLVPIAEAVCLIPLQRVSKFRKSNKLDKHRQKCLTVHEAGATVQTNDLRPLPSTSQLRLFFCSENKTVSFH